MWHHHEAVGKQLSANQNRKPVTGSMTDSIHLERYRGLLGTEWSLGAGLWDMASMGMDRLRTPLVLLMPLHHPLQPDLLNCDAFQTVLSG